MKFPIYGKNVPNHQPAMNKVGMAIEHIRRYPTLAKNLPFFCRHAYASGYGYVTVPVNVTKQSSRPRIPIMFTIFLHTPKIKLSPRSSLFFTLVDSSQQTFYNQHQIRSTRASQLDFCPAIELSSQRCSLNGHLQ